MYVSLNKYVALQVFNGILIVTYYMNFAETCLSQNHIREDFPGGAVVKNLPANAGDTGLSHGPGRSLMPWSN